MALSKYSREAGMMDSSNYTGLSENDVVNWDFFWHFQRITYCLPRLTKSFLFSYFHIVNKQLGKIL
jgi:hypothetical protein